MSSGGTGRLCILSDNQFLTTFVSRVVRIFLERYPSITCELHVSGRADSPDVEEVDCYVCADAPDRPNLIAKQVGRLAYGLYASPQYLAEHGRPFSPQDLNIHAAVKLRDGQSVQPVLRSEGVSSPYTPRFLYHTNDYWVMKTLCTQGLGIALLPDFFVVPEVRQSILVHVLPEWKPERRRVYCAYQKQRFLSKKVRAFIELVAQSIADIDSFNAYVSSATYRESIEVGS
jgi:DNA-binding transcriptional LysR family regulator